MHLLHFVSSIFFVYNDQPKTYLDILDILVDFGLHLDLVEGMARLGVVPDKIFNMPGLMSKILAWKERQTQ